jgi:Homing endonuclease associated repeat
MSESMDYKLKKISDYSEEAMTDEIKRVSAIVKSDTLSTREFDKQARISSRTVVTKFGGWNKALQKAGLRVAKIRKFSDEEVFLEIKRIWDLLGHQPPCQDGDVGAKRNKV